MSIYNFFSRCFRSYVIETFYFSETSSASTRVQPRLRDEKKISESGKQKVSTDNNMDTAKPGVADDVYEFKSVKESDNPPDTKASENVEVDNENTETPVAAPTPPEESTKRNFSEVSETQDESQNDEESRRKKRKEEGNKDNKNVATQRTVGQAKTQGNKQTSALQGKGTSNSSKSSKSI